MTDKIQTSFLKNISNIESDFNFEFETDMGIVKIYCPEQATLIDSESGSGKSDFLIKKMLVDAVEQQRPGLIYDYEGDPTKMNNPILTKIVYSAIEHQRKLQSEYSLNFAFINFTDMCRTTQVNLLSERYYNEEYETVLLHNLASTLINNLLPPSKDLEPFWAQNAKSYVFSVLYLLYKNHREEKLNTLPHAISIFLKDPHIVFRWIEKDAKLSKMMASMLTAWNTFGKLELVGVSVLQLSFIQLFKKNIFWVLSEDVLDLDVSNPKNRTLLCVGNAPSLTEAISPAISSIMSVVMTQMNSSGKEKSIFLVDNASTVYIYRIDHFIHTVRRNYVATVLAVQNFTQMVKHYGIDCANVIRAGCQNLIMGKSATSAISNILMDVNTKDYFYNLQLSEGGSVQETERIENFLHKIDIASQKEGHFFVKIANARPAFALAQFEPFHKKNTFDIIDIPKSFAIDQLNPDVAKNWTDEEKTIHQQELVVKRFKRINDDVDKLLAPYEKKKI